MKKWLDKTGAKVTFFCLLIVFTVLSAAGAGGIYYLLETNAYVDKGESLFQNIYESRCYSEVRSVYFYLQEAEPPFTVPPSNEYADMFKKDFRTSDCALEVRLGEEVLLQNYTFSDSAICTVSDDLALGDDQTITITAALDPARYEMPVGERILAEIVARRYELIAITAVSLAVWLYCLIFTMASAGHWRGYEGIHLTWFDRIPIEIWLGAFLLSYAAFTEFKLFLGPFVVIPLILLVYLFLPVFAAQCKAGTVLKESLTAWILRLFQRVFRWLGYLAANIPLVWKTTVGTVVVLLVDLLCIGNYWDTEFLVFMILVHFVLSLFLIYVAIGLRKLQKGGQALVKGDYETKVNTKYLVGDFRRHGEDLNAIQEGVQKAVEQQMRSERMKTELITNVSHDIKTPLTSIVNYVDLLKKEKIDNPKAVEYIEVLDRQSNRLRKLTEDLVEASKAATGNIPVTLADTDVNVFLTQVLGEYQQRLTEGKIESVLTPDKTNPHINADGRLLWRVLDNLLGNVCKYAMPGTRVYLSSETEDGRVLITLRNISRYPLNISADELTERFVRGDASRSTEGSGLGLSIAMGLTNLQKGEFKLSVDGDLFKVQLAFDQVPSEE